MRYQAQERAWVRRILARLTIEQRTRYEAECKTAKGLRHHATGRLYDSQRAWIAERILLEDALRPHPKLVP